MKKIIHVVTLIGLICNLPLMSASVFGQTQEATTTNLVLESVALPLGSSAIVVSVSGKVVIKPKNKNVLRNISIGDVLNDMDILFLDKGAEIKYKLESGVVYSISKVKSPTSYVIQVDDLKSRDRESK